MNLEKEIQTQSGGWVDEELGATLAPDYVADAFTKTEDKVNLEVDHANIACLTSKNNKFSLDAEGNLVVNSLTCNTSTGTTTFSILDVYPVGSIYLSINELNPSNFFGGSWELFSQGRCLVGVDTTQEEFDMVEKEGGSKYLQAHSHDVKAYFDYFFTLSKAGNSDWYGAYKATGEKWAPTFLSDGMSWSWGKATALSTGEGNSGNLQPYMTCYMWKRVA